MAIRLGIPETEVIQRGQFIAQGIQMIQIFFPEGGHDGHTTIGLGVARVLSEIREQLSGTIKLIFQLAEEGVRGAGTG